MLNIPYAGCLGLPPFISSQFSIEMCAASTNCGKFTKNLFLRGLKSFKVIDVDKSKKPVTSACYDNSMYVPICSRFHATRDNCGKITTF